jgi:hypothetical protein
LKPHLAESFKLSPDPQFIEKVRDIVGLYLNPPEAAVVLCVDEKTQVQALDRTAPILPLLPGTPARATHDYRRHGTTNLYAALDVASGCVIADLTARHRAEEFRRFLALVDRSVPEGLDVHVIIDNSSTHKTPAIHRWLVRHPRFSVHFTPSSRRSICAAALTARPGSWSPRSAPGSRTGTRTRARSCGTRRPTRSLRRSPCIVTASLTRDTRAVEGGAHGRRRLRRSAPGPDRRRPRGHAVNGRDAQPEIACR